MKKNLLFLILFIQPLIGYGQIQFDQLPPLPPASQIIANFKEVWIGDADFVDVNGDGFIDAVVTGQSYNGNNSLLYINNGLGVFTEVANVPFEEVRNSTVSSSDIDGDGDIDLLITGMNASNIRISKLYVNNGNGDFTEVANTPFAGVEDGSSEFSDVDGDGDQDILITGYYSFNVYISKLYINDGNGNFIEDATVPFENVRLSSIVFADFTGNGSEDVIISGENVQGIYVSILYTNNGSGVFTEVTNSLLEGVANSSISAADIDGDLDIDVFISGTDNAGSAISKLYLNDGFGAFSEDTIIVIDGLLYSSNSFTDVDNDGDVDLFITGKNNSNQISSKLFINNGQGVFTETPATNGADITGIIRGSIAFGDINNDGNQDLMITGETTFGSRCNVIYMNDGYGVFERVERSTFEAVYNSSTAFADIDGDGDLDLLISGDSNNSPVTILYENTGNGVFVEVINTPFVASSSGDITFGDIDGDGDLDVFIGGIFAGHSKFYVNDGVGDFVEIPNNTFPSTLFNNSIILEDFDGDGDLDVMFTSSFGISIFNNNGNNTFNISTNNGFNTYVSANQSAKAVADVDGDGDMDIVFTGAPMGPNSLVTFLYLNDGTGSFVQDVSAPFEGVNLGSLEFADVDNDGDQDLMVAGKNSSNVAITKLYTNNGSGVFTENTSTSFPGIYESSIAFADVDNDGDQDLLLSGLGIETAKIFENDGTGNFTEVLNLVLPPASSGCVSFGDVNNNGKQDLLITGWGNEGGGARRLSRLYINTTCSSSITDTVLVCNSASYTWIDGNTYTSNNYSATDTLLNSAGCDSIVKLNLTFGNSYAVTDVVNACDSITWIDGVTYFSNNNTATFLLPSQQGCDSLVSLDLTINNSTAGTDLIMACDSITWIDGITYTSSNNSATYILSNAAGCDSIVNLDLTINLNTTEIDSITSCGTYVWPVNGNTYSQSGVYTESFMNQAGCDSTHTLNLTIDCTIFGNVSVTNNNGAVCDGEAQSNAYGGVPPYTYSYSTGETTANIQNLCSGVYDLTLTDNVLNSYQTTFVISDLTISYNSDSTYLGYVDSLFSSSTFNCSYDYTQPVDSFYVDLNSITQLDQNIYQATWYLLQGLDTFIITNVYYTTQDINGSFAFSLTIYCDDSNLSGSNNRSVLRSVNFIFKTKGSLSLESYIEEEIELYPNPTTGLFYLDVPESMIGSPLILTNSVGQIVFKSKVESSSSGYNIYGLAEGVYFLQLQTSNSVITKKLKFK